MRLKRAVVFTVAALFLLCVRTESSYGWWWTPKPKARKHISKPKAKPKALKPKALKPKAAAKARAAASKAKAAALRERARAKAAAVAERADARRQYIQNHDLNGDGVVNQKDRLLWLNRNKETITTTVINDENEDLMEAMDLNGDGVVDKKEAEIFYNRYDVNGNGVLEEAEINRAVD